MLLSIDPGKRACGVALFEDRELVTAALVEARSILEGPRAWKAMADSVLVWCGSHNADQVQQVIIEQPSAYVTDKPYKTLLLQDLIAIEAYIFAAFPGVPAFRYRPNQWKGSMNKEQTKARAYKRLQPFETQRIYLPSAKSKQHNVWDAVAIGLHHLGRFKPRRSYARK